MIISLIASLHVKDAATKRVNRPEDGAIELEILTTLKVFIKQNGNFLLFIFFWLAVYIQFTMRHFFNLFCYMYYKLKSYFNLIPFVSNGEHEEL